MTKSWPLADLQSQLRVKTFHCSLRSWPLRGWTGNEREEAIRDIVRRRKNMLSSAPLICRQTRWWTFWMNSTLIQSYRSAKWCDFLVSCVVAEDWVIRLWGPNPVNKGRMTQLLIWASSRRLGDLKWCLSDLGYQSVAADENWVIY